MLSRYLSILSANYHVLLVKVSHYFSCNHLYLLIWDYFCWKVYGRIHCYHLEKFRYFICWYGNQSRSAKKIIWIPFFETPQTPQTPHPYIFALPGITLQPMDPVTGSGWKNRNLSSLSNVTTEDLKEGLENRGFHYDESGHCWFQVFSQFQPSWVTRLMSFVSSLS